MYFGNYGLWNTWWNKCLTIPVSEDPSTSNTVRGLNNVEISTTPPLPYLLVTAQTIALEEISFSDIQSILFLIEIIWDSQLRYSYLRNKKHFLNLFLHFWKLDKILNLAAIAEFDAGSSPTEHVVKNLSYNTIFRWI